VEPPRHVPSLLAPLLLVLGAREGRGTRGVGEERSEMGMGRRSGRGSG